MTKRKGIIVGYKVEYSSVTNNNTASEVVSTRSLRIQGLEQNTEYSIRVSAATVKGFGPPSEPITVTSDQGGKSTNA